MTVRQALQWISDEAGLRFLARRKAACAVAVLTMALALGANTLVFSVTKAFLLTSFGLPDPNRLFVIAPIRELPGRGEVVFSEAYPNYRLIRETQRSFADVTTFVQSTASWDDDGEARPLQASRVTASFFSTMRVMPILGRAIDTSEEGPNPAQVVVIGNGLWRSGFAGDPAVIGRTMQINGAQHTIIGVMPPGFTHPLPTELWLPFDIPKNAWTSVTGARNLGFYGRLKDGVSVEAAHSEMPDFTKRTLEATKDNTDFRYELRSIRQVLLPAVDRTVFLVQLGAILLVLLAVSNLATLLIAWGFDRRQEFAVRLALGARSTRVVRMLVLQSVAVVTAGGLVGVAVAMAALPAVRSLDVTPAIGLFFAHLEIDAAVLLWTGAAIALSGVLAGILPAWFARRTDLAVTLRSTTRSVSLSPLAIRWQKGMVLAQATLSVMVLSAAAMIGLSFRNLLDIPDGFVPGDRMVARVQIPDVRYATHEARAAFAVQLLDNLHRERELETAEFTSTLPVGDNIWGGRFFPELPDGSTPEEPLLLHFRRTSPDYLATMGIPLLRGRAFTAQDDMEHPKVAIVSRAVADRLWPGENAVGKRFYRVVNGAPAPQPLEIIGVAGNTMDAGYSAPPGETVYVPYAQVSQNQMSIVVKPRGDRAAALEAVRHALRTTDPVLAANNTASLESLVRQANALTRLQTILLMMFAIVAVSMVALGSYGVMTQLVSSREREFALRLLFGAAPASLGGSVLLQVSRLTASGAVLGIAAIWMMSGLLQPFVFGMQARSVSVLIVVSIAILSLSAAAALPPTARAMRVDARKGMAAG